ncbi:hypothetical protein M758_2G046100 [Ceratodon purpureus]|nr:hypothetical protein M758_2G046100 [Ceratodon purpureus]
MLSTSTTLTSSSTDSTSSIPPQPTSIAPTLHLHHHKTPLHHPPPTRKHLSTKLHRSLFHSQKSVHRLGSYHLAGATQQWPAPVHTHLHSKDYGLSCRNRFVCTLHLRHLLYGATAL